MVTSNGVSSGRILTVTPNPALDITYRLERLQPGEGHRVRPLVRAGGKGVNVARVGHQVGHPVVAVAPVGGGDGARFRAELEASGVPHRLVTVPAETRRSVAIVETAGDRTTILNEVGAPLGAEGWHELDSVVTSLLDERDGCAPVSVLVGSGSLPEDAPPDFYARLVRHARARGIPTVVDTSGEQLLEAARAGADLLKPNQQELAETVGGTDPIGGARQLLDLGAQRVMVSLGSAGMVALSQARATSHLRARLSRPLFGNPTGAGDAAVAALAVALAAAEHDLETLLRKATAWSAAAVLAPQAGAVSDDYRELESRLTVTEETQR
jgi:1-phosphofructokinase family hexose kinase